MSRPSSAAEAEPTPTPTPASEERRASRPLSTARGGVPPELLDRFAHCPSIDELPPELRDNPFIRYLVGRTREQEAHEMDAVRAHREAEALYGDDPQRILAAIEDGTHPLQRRRHAKR